MSWKENSKQYSTTMIKMHSTNKDDLQINRVMAFFGQSFEELWPYNKGKNARSYYHATLAYSVVHTNVSSDSL